MIQRIINGMSVAMDGMRVVPRSIQLFFLGLFVLTVFINKFVGGVFLIAFVSVSWTFGVIAGRIPQLSGKINR